VARNPTVTTYRVKKIETAGTANDKYQAPY
jgi:hypothetical protein